jgi:uncharacterized protein YndB with AHSA1/START domain
MIDTPFDPALDLVLERVVDLPPELVWAAWTRPEHITKWFTPAPWTTPEAEVDLRPGGINSGCFLDVVENRRLVWTGALGPGYRPNDSTVVGFPFTAIITLEPDGPGTRYTARVMHAIPEHCTAHAEMGFSQGWGAALDQLVAYIRGDPSTGSGTA